MLSRNLDVAGDFQDLSAMNDEGSRDETKSIVVQASPTPAPARAVDTAMPASEKPAQLRNCRLAGLLTRLCPVLRSRGQ